MIVWELLSYLLELAPAGSFHFGSRPARLWAFALAFPPSSTCLEPPRPHRLPHGPHSRPPPLPHSYPDPAPGPCSELTTQCPPLPLLWAAAVCFCLAPQTAISKREEIWVCFFHCCCILSHQCKHSMESHFCRAKAPLCLLHCPLVFHYLFFLFSHKHQLLFDSAKDKSISLSLIISLGRVPRALWSEFFTTFRLRPP